MTKLFAWLFAAALVIGLGSAPTLTYAAEEGATEEAEESGTDSGEAEAPTEEAEEATE